MRSKFIGAAAAILASGLSIAVAQAPSPQTQPTEMPEQAAPPSPAPPGLLPSGTSIQAPTQAAAQPRQHRMSGCQRAIQASEKALEKSQAGPDTIAQAWQHIESARQEKGQACRDEARQAQEML